jgi:hypothetical protein
MTAEQWNALTIEERTGVLMRIFPLPDSIQRQMVERPEEQDSRFSELLYEIQAKVEQVKV